MTLAILTRFSVLEYVPISRNMRKTNDITFAQTNVGPLLLDLHLPERADGSDRWPVIVWIHGSGCTRQTAPLLPTQSGYAVATIDYRLTSQAIWPSQLEDCQAAISFLRAHAGRYSLDAQRIGAWGKSAGGHLVAMLAVLSGLASNEEASWRIQAGCDYCGPTDLSSFAQPESRAEFPVLHEVICGLLGGDIKQRQELARQASPIRFVNAQCAPLRIAHGDKDDVVPVRESESFYKALLAVGADVQLEIVEGRGHHIANVETDTRTVQFFDQYLRKPVYEKNPGILD